MSKENKFPFKNIFILTSGDIVWKTLNFLTFAYLARTLGVAYYGVLEFALAITTYFQVFADMGIEIWATRAIAQGSGLRETASRVIPLRLFLAFAAILVLFLLFPWLPDYPGLKLLLALYGAGLLLQAINFRWGFMGKEKTGRVAIGLVIGQIIFSTCVFLFVHGPQNLFLIPASKIIGDFVIALYYGWYFYVASRYDDKHPISLRKNLAILRASYPMGLSQVLGLMGFNLDTVLIGFILNPVAVGLYNVAYKPITIVLTVPISYYLALFPTMSRAFTESREHFHELVNRSLRIASIFSIPVGVGGFFLAVPIILLLYGPDYTDAVPALRILSWSASLVILRGTFRQGFNAASKQKLELRIAAISISINLVLNLVLIPRLGMVGAALSTLISETIWFTSSWVIYSGTVSRVPLAHLLIRPVISGIVMGIWFFLTSPLFWGVQAVGGILVYFGSLLVLRDSEIRSWLRLPTEN